MEADGSKDSLSWVSSTEQGRYFLWDLLSYCGVYQDLAGEANAVFKSLGKREVGLHVLGLLADIDDEVIFNMMREAKNRQLTKEIEDERAKQRDEHRNKRDDIIRDIIGYSTDSAGGIHEYQNGGAIF